ncbi:hypothetical protein M413DRAFT_14215 [Hebeloma cylindrosporum]|uniref:Uncharacterized protein n=1 Tax=Hebeloma cylindrosporum TaxID=76867 RepID=A0A0C2Y4K1_HEBCY|nr:hypothetical protein M413DRAFT_14215 [Hebeloma cylindrosporum h7]
MADNAPPKQRPWNPHRSPWTQREHDIMQKELAQYRTMNKAERKLLLGFTVLPALYEIHPNLDERDKAALKTKVKGWFSNNARNKEPRKKFLLLPNKLTLRKVIAAKEKEAIEKNVRTLSGAAPGSKEYFEKYQQGFKMVKDTLPAEKLARYQRATEEWEEKGYPEEVKRREADANLTHIVDDFQKVIFDRMGARGIFVTWHTAPDGRLGMVFHDNNPSLGAVKLQRFEDICPGFATKMLEHGLIYANYIMGATDGTIPAQVHLRKQKRNAIDKGLGRSKEGYPIFKEVAEGQKETLLERKHILRAFLNQHYVPQALATGGKRSTPFKAVAKDPNSWADAKYWAPNVSLCDPSDMTERDVTALLDLWRKRQESGPASDIFRWSYVLSSRRNDSALIPALYRNLSPSGDEAAGGAAGKKGKGQKKKGKNKKGTRAKPSKEEVRDTDEEAAGMEEFGDGEMNALDATVNGGRATALGGLALSTEPSEFGAPEWTSEAPITTDVGGLALSAEPTAFGAPDWTTEPAIPEVLEQDPAFSGNPAPNRTPNFTGSMHNGQYHGYQQQFYPQHQGGSPPFSGIPFYSPSTFIGAGHSLTFPDDMNVGSAGGFNFATPLPLSIAQMGHAGFHNGPIVNNYGPGFSGHGSAVNFSTASFPSLIPNDPGEVSGLHRGSFSGPSLLTGSNPALGNCSSLSLAATNGPAPTHTKPAVGTNAATASTKSTPANPELIANNRPITEPPALNVPFPVLSPDACGADAIPPTDPPALVQPPVGPGKNRPRPKPTPTVGPIVNHSDPDQNFIINRAGKRSLHRAEVEQIPKPKKTRYEDNIPQPTHSTRQRVPI